MLQNKAISLLLSIITKLVVIATETAVTLTQRYSLLLFVIRRASLAREKIK